MSDAKCRTHEIIDAAKARGDRSPERAACIVALKDAYAHQSAVASFLVEKLQNPVQRLALEIQIRDNQAYWAEALAKLLVAYGEDPKTLLPILHQIEAASDADMEDIKAGKISINDLRQPRD